ncbi:MAG: NAD(P)-dependent oxidoreductase [Lachnospiraceae bacterium]|jgi:nucleoside-diphosphate-sugar epimerase|nr:NAD(P)-dependent oxidoreductase [Lachnospiraceae bacterium]
MAKYFITGGAGFLGINLIRYLLERGHSAVSYDIAADFDYPEKGDERLTLCCGGDIRDLASLTQAMAGCEIVVHCAAALPLYSPEDIRTTDIDGSRNVLLAAKQNGIRRVIQISSTAVYGIPDHHPLVESDRLVGVGPYGEAKIAAEAVCAKFREEGMVVPIIRPKSFVGPERLGAFVLLYDWAHDGRGFPMIGKGNNRYQLLDVYDLCEAIYLSATLPDEVVNDVFNVGAEEYATMREDWQAVLDKAGFGKKIVPFPKKPIIWTLRILEALHLSPLYKWIYETAAEDSFVSIDKAKTVLGWQPRYSNQDALLRNYAWYLENLEQFKNASGVSHRVPWKQGILGVAKKFF